MVRSSVRSQRWVLRCRLHLEAYYPPSGPYAAGVLRFEITFPPSYPIAPPAIRFTTDVFHPLVTPLTSYTYASGTPRNDAISTGDQECLPPGGFSLKYGFPHWFEDPGQSNISSQGSSPNASMSSEPRQQSAESRGMPGSLVVQTSDIASQTSCSPAQGQWNPRVASPITSKPPKSVVSIVDYMKRAFDDYQILDSVPLELAGNSGAWKAWQAHRKHMFYISTEKQAVSTSLFGSSGNKGLKDGSLSSEPAVLKRSKQPEEWNWNGVWQDRVYNGVNASISGPVLYGLGVGDEPVRLQHFLVLMWLTVHQDSVR